jgi:1-deoxy-D-xylulose-5-phosphate synthase
MHSDEFVIPILGDASLTCGLTLEALNNIPKDLKNFIVILNDNKMSISKNTGAISNILSRIVNSPTSNKIYDDLEQMLAKIPSLGSFLAKQGTKVKESIKNLISAAPFLSNLGYPMSGHSMGITQSSLLKPYML